MSEPLTIEEIDLLADVIENYNQQRLDFEFDAQPCWDILGKVRGLRGELDTLKDAAQAVTDAATNEQALYERPATMAEHAARNNTFHKAVAALAAVLEGVSDES